MFNQLFLNSIIAGSIYTLIALGRALMLRPEVLLLDETSLGLSPKAVKKSFETIKNISTQFRTSILIVEQKVKSVLEITGRAYVLRLGKVVLTDISASMTPERSKQAFLGN
jgi:branched-chain amino acid transport system ATP-binding protein